MNKTIKNAKTHLFSLAEQIAIKSVSPSNDWGWPPNCMGIIYQPRRLKMNKTIKNAKTHLFSLAEQIAIKSVSPSNDWGWPPNCMGIIYQPKRPQKLRKEKPL